MFNNEIDFDKELEAVNSVKVESKGASLTPGKYLAVIAVVPQLDETGVHKTAKLKLEDGSEDGNHMIPLFKLRFILLGEGKVNIYPVKKDNKIVGSQIDVPIHYGIEQIMFMNDNNLKTQFMKNNLAEMMDSKTDIGTLSYNKLNGKICTVQLDWDAWQLKNKNKKQLSVNLMDTESVSSSVYQITKTYNEDTKSYEDASISISVVKQETVLKIIEAVDAKKQEAKDKKNAAALPDTSFNASEFDESSDMSSKDLPF